MPKNPYFDKIIPGIALVPDLDLETFFATEEGRGLKLLLCKFEQKKNSHSYYGDTAAIRFIQRDNANQEQIQAQIRENSGFTPLKMLIYKAMLKQLILECNFIDSEDQTILIDKPYTAALYHSYFIEKQPHAVCINRWQRSFDADPDENSIQIRDLIQIRQIKLVDDTKQKIGFLLASSAQSEIEMNYLLYFIAINLYYYKQTKANKKALLEGEFRKYLDHHNLHQRKYAFPDLKASFSYLIDRVMQQRDIKKTKEQLDRIANVHLLFGILGLREPAGWILENIDIYNYVALADDVSTMKTVLFAFAKPLRPFFAEYVQIAKLEKNPLSFLLRATLPIIIITCFVAFAFSLMVPFAMHAIIEIIMLIPTLYASVVLASYYVDLKNQAFEQYIIHWYGSRYAHHAYTANERMIMGFSDNAMIAEKVCNYYVWCFKECDDIIGSLAKKFERGLLTEEQISYYEAMLKHEALLKMEWYDIHDNHYFGVDSIKTLVSKRLHHHAADAYKKINSEGKVYIDRLVEELEQHLVLSDNTENSPNPTLRQAFQLHMRWSMFKPEESLKNLAKKCVGYEKAIELVEEMQFNMNSRQSVLDI
jgi:hypothetical protein